MDYDYSDLFVAAVVGAILYRLADWAFVRFMNRLRTLPRDFPDDHCGPGCKVPR